MRWWHKDTTAERELAQLRTQQQQVEKAVWDLMQEWQRLMPAKHQFPHTGLLYGNTDYEQKVLAWLKTKVKDLAYDAARPGVPPL
jgi:hypothetical protein